MAKHVVAINAVRIETDQLWAVRGATRVKGNAFVNDRLHLASDLAALFDACATYEQWHATLAKLNGNYAVVTEHDRGLWAGVDHVRSIPLFYGVRGHEAVLSDRAEIVREQLGERKQCSAASAEFRVTGYVTGRGTLFAKVRQLQAGECLAFYKDANPQPVCTRYYQWRHRDPSGDTNQTLMAQLHETHRRVAVRLVEGLHGRCAVLPLSGGYDSRLLAVMLKEQKYDNVLCYTYGLPDNWEAKISEALARHLGFRWTFVPYSGAKWRDWGATPDFKRYCQFASNHASIPHVQDWPAIYELRKQQAIPDDAVVVPGHSGDFLAGSHIPRWFEHKAAISRTELQQTLLDAHYSLWDWTNAGVDSRSEFTRRIDAVGEPVKDGTPADAADQLECWDMNERQGKFICNSVRVYDFFGLAWRLPLFDRELLEFWARVPMALRVGRRLYFEYVKNYQQLPVLIPNQDRGALATGLIKIANATGLRPVAKALLFRLRRNQWESIYENCREPPLAWFTLIDRDLFKRTYTGKQTLHAYLARLGAEGAFRSDLDAVGRA